MPLEQRIYQYANEINSMIIASAAAILTEAIISLCSQSDQEYATRVIQKAGIKIISGTDGKNAALWNNVAIDPKGKYLQDYIDDMLRDMDDAIDIAEKIVFHGGDPESQHQTKYSLDKRGISLVNGAWKDGWDSLANTLQTMNFEPDLPNVTQEHIDIAETYSKEFYAHCKMPEQR